MDPNRGTSRMHPYFISSVTKRVESKYMSPYNMQANASHLNAEMNPNLPLAISSYNMEVNLGSHPMFIQNSLPMIDMNGVLYFPNCVLYPPSYDRRSKTPEIDPSCKSVFVSFMIKNITEQIIREILSSCGEIDSVKKSEGCSYFVKFVNMGSADRAVSLSQYTVKIYNKDDSENSGIMYVYHSKYTFWPEKEKNLVPFSEHKALIDKLKNQETFKDALGHLTTKLDRGECNTMTSDYFIKMIQSVQNHAERLISEKNELYEELMRAKKKMKESMVEMSSQFSELIDFYNVLEKLNFWSNFNVNKDQIIEMKEGRLSFEQFYYNQTCKDSGDDSELSTNKSNFLKTPLSSSDQKMNKDLEKLKEESIAIQDKLQISLKESAAFVKMKEENDHKDSESDLHCSECEKKLEIIQDILAKLSQEQKLNFVAYLHQEKVFKNEDSKKYLEQNIQRRNILNGVLSHVELHLICSMAMFFNVHTFGISIDYLHSYCTNIFPNIKAIEVENLIRRFPDIFREEYTGVGASLAKKWYYTVLKNKNDSNEVSSDI